MLLLLLSIFYYFRNHWARFRMRGSTTITVDEEAGTFGDERLLHLDQDTHTITLKAAYEKPAITVTEKYTEPPPSCFHD